MSRNWVCLPVVLLPAHHQYTSDRATLLQPAKEGDAGIDLHATEDVVLYPGRTALVPTGFHIAIPDGMEGQVRSRSGLALREGLIVLNAPGTIDSGYRGEVKVILHNTNPPVTTQLFDTLLTVLDGSIEVHTLQEQQDLHLANSTIRITRGDRIAQLVIAKFVKWYPNSVASLQVSERGEGGFGSTGT